MLKTCGNLISFDKVKVNLDNSLWEIWASADRQFCRPSSKLFVLFTFYFESLWKTDLQFSYDSWISKAQSEIDSVWFSTFDKVDYIVMKGEAGSEQNLSLLTKVGSCFIISWSEVCVSRDTIRWMNIILSLLGDSPA